jgi:hypothetical protein
LQKIEKPTSEANIIETNNEENERKKQDIRKNLLHKAMMFAFPRNKGPRLKNTKKQIDMSAPYVHGWNSQNM